MKCRNPEPVALAVDSQTPGGRVVVSSRVRLARNLNGERFPDWNDPAGRKRVFKKVAMAVLDSGSLRDPGLVDLEAHDNLSLCQIHERRLISSDLLERGAGGGLVMDSDGEASVMINEEDHLRIQVIRRGLDLSGAWESADAIDSRIEPRLEYAFSTQLGYLTACPSNVGTGLRASVMLHLLGLRLTDDIDPVMRALDQLHLNVRGVGGEGSDAAGHMFQISNQGTLGQTEREVIDTLQRFVLEVVRQERLARLRLMRDDARIVEDCVARALALLQNARVIPADEALDYLSGLLLGVELGLLSGLTIERIEDMMLGIQPGFLQRLMGREAAPELRDVYRADWLRGQLADVCLLA